MQIEIPNAATSGKMNIRSNAPAAPAASVPSGDRVTLSSRSLVQLIPGLGPRRDGDQAYQAVHGFAQSLRSGSVYVEDFNKRLPDLQRDAVAACSAQNVACSSQNILAALIPTNEVSADNAAAALMRHGGLVTTGSARVSIDQEHKFEMSYGSDGGFRGSRAWEQSGETRVVDVDVLQKPGAGPDDPAAIRFRYGYPAFFTFDMNGTSLAGKSGSDALYFVPKRSDVSGLEGLLADRERVDTLQPVATMVSDLVNSLDRQSPVSIQTDSRGFGRVGTSYDDVVRMPVGFNPKRETRGFVAALLTEQAASDVLGIATAPPKAAPPPSLVSRIATGAFSLGAVGAAAAAIGYAAGPVGIAITAGLALLSGAGFAAAVDGSILKANGATDREVVTQRVKAFALGAVMGGAAGATAGIAGTPVAIGAAAAGWATAGALTGLACR